MKRVESSDEDLKNLKIEKAVESIAKWVQFFLLIDTRQFLYHKNRTTSQKFIWIFNQIFVIWTATFGIAWLSYHGFLPDDPHLLNQAGEFFRFYGGSRHIFYITVN